MIRKRPPQQRLAGEKRVSHVAPWKVGETENAPCKGNRSMADM